MAWSILLSLLTTSSSTSKGKKASEDDCNRGPVCSSVQNVRVMLSHLLVAPTLEQWDLQLLLELRELARPLSKEGQQSHCSPAVAYLSAGLTNHMLLVTPTVRKRKQPFHSRRELTAPQEERTLKCKNLKWTCLAVLLITSLRQHCVHTFSSITPQYDIIIHIWFTEILLFIFRDSGEWWFCVSLWMHNVFLCIFLFGSLGFVLFCFCFFTVRLPIGLES